MRIASLQFAQLFACDHCLVLSCRQQELEQVTQELEALGGFDIRVKPMLINCVTATPWSRAA